MLYLLLPLQTTTPRTLKPTIRVTTTLMPQTTTRVNKTTGRPTTTNSSLTEVTSSNRASSSTWSTSSGLISVSSTVTPGKYRKVISWYTIATQNVIWKPAVIECTHIFSTYVVTNVFHFLAFFTGFYMFRIQESEGLNALIEKARMISCSVWQMPRGGGGGTAIYGPYRYVPLWRVEGYGFQAVYSIGYINQSVWV